jgi:hypothetical protein
MGCCCCWLIASPKLITGLAAHVNRSGPTVSIEIIVSVSLSSVHVVGTRASSAVAILKAWPQDEKLNI